MELVRYESPVKAPQGLAWDGTQLWVSSCETNRISAIDPLSGQTFDEIVPPGEPFGLTAIERALWIVVGFGDDSDDRYLMRYSAANGFDARRIPCPDLSGSFLAFDGGSLWLSQAWNKKLLELSDRYEVRREIDLERRPVGITFAQGRLYLITMDDDWGNGQFATLDVRDSLPLLEPIEDLAFTARSVAFDGARFWTADRGGNAIVEIRSFSAP